MGRHRDLDGRSSVLWVGVYVVATFLSFPHPLGDRILDLGWLLAWGSPAALVLAVRSRSLRGGIAVGFAGGLLAHAAVLHWIYVVTVRYGHAPPAVGVVAPVLLAVYVALGSAAFGGGMAWLRARGAAWPLALAALWTVIDHLRSFVLTGFPWATLGYAQHENPWLLALAPWTGVYGLSFSTVLGSTSALAALAPRSAGVSGGRPAALAGLGLLGALLALGGVGRPEAEPTASTVRTAVLQGNIDQGVKWSPDWAERTLATYEDLSRAAVAQGARLLVWPETAVPGAPDADPDLRERLALLARELRVTLVVGAVGFDLPAGASPERGRLYDSAFLFDARGTLRDRYDKTQLVPFGEYLPLRALLGRFVRAIATGSAGRDVSPGEAPRRISLPAAPGEERSPLPAGIPICYELLFPDLVRRFVADGAGVLLGITNDAWYGRTGAPYQFLVMTALRSAETGVWTARAANTGVSAFIDARGRVRDRTRIFERGFLVSDVPVLLPEGPRTFYVRHGDVFAGACWLGLVGASLFALRRAGGPPLGRK